MGMFEKKKPQPPIIFDSPTPPRLDFTNIYTAFGYIAGYCSKHSECNEKCRLYDIEDEQCIFFDDAAGPPCDWELPKR